MIDQLIRRSCFTIKRNDYYFYLRVHTMLCAAYQYNKSGRLSMLFALVRQTKWMSTNEWTNRVCKYLFVFHFKSMSHSISLHIYPFCSKKNFFFSKISWILESYKLWIKMDTQTHLTFSYNFLHVVAVSLPIALICCFFWLLLSLKFRLCAWDLSFLARPTKQKWMLSRYQLRYLSIPFLSILVWNEIVFEEKNTTYASSWWCYLL